ncbi:glycosyltransferase family 39 protein, partial [Dissulfurirhabdus thermomarina]
MRAAPAATGGDAALWHRRFLVLFFGVLALRVAILALLRLDLSPDEAYYWDWSRRLDWGYYSKPPMVAWIIAGAVDIFGHSALGVRLPAAVLGTVTLWGVYLLGRRLFSARAGFWAAAAAAALPGSAVLCLAMTIDAPLVCCWSLALFTFWRAAEGGRGHAGWWLLTGALVGAGLLSKQTMAAFWPLAGLFLAADPGRRRLLRSPWPYAAVLASGLMVAPVLAWNARHGWITFRHTAHHFHAAGGAVSLKTFLAFAGSQLGVVSPILWGLALWVGGAWLARARRAHGPVAFLLAMSTVPVFGVLALSLHQPVNANWAAPFHLGSLVLLAGWAEGAVDRPAPPPGRRVRLFRAGVWTAAAMSLLLYAVPPAVVRS